VWRIPTAHSILVAAALALPLGAHAQAGFAKPEEATNALIDAIAANDPAPLPKLLGPQWRDWFPERVDPEDVTAFLEKSSQSRTVKVEGDRAVLVVGRDPYTLPVPLQRGKDGLWRFDPAGARVMLEERRIGANERAAMRAALAYVDAQLEYASRDRNGDGLLEYASKILSSPGKRDGLIWPASLGDESPLGDRFLPRNPGEGYHGYRFKVLTAQGPAAKGGARSYVIGNRMVSGFGLVAWPVAYGESGVMSFMVNQNGQLFERDLGPGTAKAAAAITAFNPEPPWKPVNP
jgi:hypothetical protein